MLSGSITTQGAGNYALSYSALTFAWEATQNISSNKSIINWTLSVSAGGGTYFSRYLKVNGNVKYCVGVPHQDYSPEGDYFSNGTQIASGSFEVNHNQDGTGSFSVNIGACIQYSYWYMNPSYQYYGQEDAGNWNSRGSATFTLDQIPRAATIVSAPNFTDLINPVLSYNNPLGNLATTLQAAIYQGDSTALCAYRDVSKTGNSYTFNLTDAEKTVLRNLATTSAGITVRFYIKTIYAGITYTNYVEKTFTVADSADVKPVISLSVTPDNSVIPSTYRSNFSGLYIQNKSKAVAAITASGLYGASISSYALTANGKTYSGSSITTETFDISGDIVITATVTDTRGFTSSVSVTITVLPYSKPTLSNVSVFRSDSSGDPDEESNKIWIRATRSYQKMIVDGVQKNDSILQYRYKVATASSYGGYFALISRGSSTDSVNILLGTTFPVNTAYKVQVRVYDNIGESTIYEFDIPTNKVSFHWKRGGRAFALGRYAGDDDTFMVAWDSTFEGDVDAQGALNIGSLTSDSINVIVNAIKSSILNSVYPVGSIYMSTNSTSPATLFGGTWTQIEDTFLLAAGTNHAAGDTGGEESHVLTIDEMPSHTHRVAAVTWNKPSSWCTITENYGNVTHGIDSESAGGDQAHNNMPPYLAVYVWKRTA